MSSNNYDDNRIRRVRLVVCESLDGPVGKVIREWVATVPEAEAAGRAYRDQASHKVGIGVEWHGKSDHDLWTRHVYLMTAEQLVTMAEKENADRVQWLKNLAAKHAAEKVKKKEASASKGARAQRGEAHFKEGS